MSSLDLVHRYFDCEADRFDAIYDRDKPLYQRVGDAVFRRVICERYSLTINSIGAAGRTVLDVGCGPGRYGIELARRGAARCLGIDVAEQMINIARAESKEGGVADRCEWVISDFLSWESGEVFDAVVAMGYFDYLEDPTPHLEKMIGHCKDRVFVSLPKRWEVRTPIRIARFRLARGFVRFYSRAEALGLFRTVGPLGCLSLVDLGRDYIAIYDAGAARRAGSR